VRARAIAYLRRQQDRDGGFPSQPGEGSNAQSTAWAVQGLDASRVNPATVRRGGTTPVGYLRSLIRPSGAIDYSRGVAQTPVWVTGEVLMALAGQPLPLAALPAPTPHHHAHAPSQTPSTPPAHAPHHHHGAAPAPTTSSSTTTSAAPPPPTGHSHSGGGHHPAAHPHTPAGPAANGSPLATAVAHTGTQTVAALNGLM
jgi:hypothetical protein